MNHMGTVATYIVVNSELESLTIETKNSYAKSLGPALRCHGREEGKAQGRLRRQLSGTSSCTSGMVWVENVQIIGFHRPQQCDPVVNAHF